MAERIQVIDSHTAGEPTRVIVSGGPDLGEGSLTERRERFRLEFDHYRSAIVNEPRGSDAVVGAWLGPPDQDDSVAGVIFFNNVGYLGMCVHGTIGVVASLALTGRIGAGEHRLDTPVGTITATLHDDGRVTVANVASRRTQARVPVDVPGLGRVHGDVAWGGNWFFLVDDHGQELHLSNVERLTDVAWRIRLALTQQAITGRDGAEIDHIELFGPALLPDGDSRNFVLCPGKAYDRSPCGTGTSAKLACLAADGKLAAGQIWRQESVIGSSFEARYEWQDDDLIPYITGSAHITAESQLILREEDPFRYGIRP